MSNGAMVECGPIPSSMSAEVVERSCGFRFQRPEICVTGLCGFAFLASTVLKVQDFKLNGSGPLHDDLLGLVA